MKKRLQLISFLLCLSGALQAQNAKVKFQLGKVNHDGMCKVQLSPELRSHAKEDLSDLRLSSTSDSLIEIAYLLQEGSSPPSKEIYSHLSWEQIDNNGLPYYLVRTKEKSICGFILKVANHRNERRFAISGSNNKKEWFAISDVEILNPSIETYQTFYWKSISFPKVDYEFIKIHFLDTAQLGIKILNIGELLQETVESELVLIDGLQVSFEEMQLEKITRIKIFSNKPQQLNQVQFLVQTPSFYMREARIYEKNYITPKRGSSYWQEDDLGRFNLKYGTSNTFQWSHYLDDTIFIEVANKNNPPLSFEKVFFKQRPICLYAFCNVGHTPTIFLGDSLLNLPQYDLAAFSEEILHSKLDTLSLGKLQIIQSPSGIKLEMGFWQNEIFLWICLGTGAMSLLFFSLKLLNEKKSS